MNKIEIKNEFGLDEKYFARCKEIYDSSNPDLLEDTETSEFFDTTCSNHHDRTDLWCLASLMSTYLMGTGPSHPDSNQVDYIMAMLARAKDAHQLAIQKEITEYAKELGLSKKQLKNILDIVEDTL